MTAVFPKFSSLPPELRSIIWQMAIRQERHDSTGVHFFTIGNGPREVQLENSFPFHFRIGDPILFGAPIFDPTSEKSWVENNRSTYLIDAGLWTACKESRTIIEQNYNTVRWKQRNEYFQKSYYSRKSGPFDMRCSPCLGRSWRGAEDRTFVVFPRKDLFCFQQLNDRSLDRKADRWDKMTQLSLSYLTYDNLQYLAFEYDETWDFDIEKHDPWDLAREDNARGLFFRILSVQWQVTRAWVLYLIDYDRRLTPNAKLTQRFHANDCVYVTFEDFRPITASGAYEFLRRMNHWAENHLEERMTSKVQVLTCVKK